MTTPIPVPPYSIPILNHAAQVDKDTPINTFNKWVATYGEIFEVYMFSGSICDNLTQTFSSTLYFLRNSGASTIFVSSAALCADISNDQKFTKKIGGALEEIRALVGDGLFTVRCWINVQCDGYEHFGSNHQAHKDEPNWGIARAYNGWHFETIK